MNPTDAAAKKKLVTLTRTDFLIQFVWQPPKPEERPKTPEELNAKIAETVQADDRAQTKTTVVVIPKESDIEAALRSSSRRK